LRNVTNITYLARERLALGADLTGWGVGRTGVLRCLPLCPHSAWADFGSALRDDATLVDWAELRLELDFGVADLGGLVDVATEGLLPACRVRPLLASPAVCVGGTGLSKGGV
jgi:hypothetical protein